MNADLIMTIIFIIGLLCWAVRYLEREDLASCSGQVSNRTALRRWIETNLPELDAELGPMSMDQVRMRLNAMTGCNVQGGDSVEDGSAVFLAALQAQHAERGGTPP